MKEKVSSIIYLYSNQPLFRCGSTYYTVMKNFIDFLSELSDLSDSYRLVVPCRQVSDPPKGAFRIDIRGRPIELSYYEGHLQAVFFSFFNSLRMRRLLLSTPGPVIIGCPGPNSFLLWLSILAPARTGFVFFIRGDTLRTVQEIYRGRFPLNLIASFLVKVFMGRIRSLLSNERARIFVFGERLKDQYQGPGWSVNVIYPLLDREFMRTDARSEIHAEGPLKILYIGRLSPEKNILSLMNGCEKAKKAGIDVKLTIAGFGELKPAIEKKIACSPDCIFSFEGYISDIPSLISLYDSHDLFCLPSLTEGTPRVVIEAFSRGLAVLSTRVGSLPDLFQGKIRFIEGFGEDDICSGITWCYKNRVMLSAMGDAGRRLVQKFLISENAKVVDSILRTSEDI